MVIIPIMPYPYDGPHSAGQAGNHLPNHAVILPHCSGEASRRTCVEWAFPEPALSGREPRA
jgi:hypothetical protein